MDVWIRNKDIDYIRLEQLMSSLGKMPQSYSC